MYRYEYKLNSIATCQYVIIVRNVDPLIFRHFLNVDEAFEKSSKRNPLWKFLCNALRPDSSFGRINYKFFEIGIQNWKLNNVSSTYLVLNVKKSEIVNFTFVCI